MKKRGFDTQEIADKLHEKGIEIKPPTLAKYLNEFRQKQARKPDRPSPRKQEETSSAAAAKPEPVKAEMPGQPERTPEASSSDRTRPSGSFEHGNPKVKAETCTF
jgi:hypothetical protein